MITGETAPLVSPELPNNFNPPKQLVNFVHQPAVSPKGFVVRLDAGVCPPELLCALDKDFNLAVLVYVFP